VLGEYTKKLTSAAKRLPASGDAETGKKVNSPFLSKGERVEKIIHADLKSMYVFIYYSYVEFFKVRPSTLEDMFTGIAYIRVKTKIEEVYKPAK